MVSQLEKEFVDVILFLSHSSFVLNNGVLSDYPDRVEIPPGDESQLNN